MQNVQYYLDNTASDMYFIYGGLDPWSATKVSLPMDAKNCKVLILENGYHDTRINSFPRKRKKEIYKEIKNTLLSSP